MHCFLCELESYSSDVVEHEPAGASHCFDVFRKLNGVVQGHAKVLCTLGGGHRGVANPDGEVFERAGICWEEEQLHLVEVELEVVDRHPS